MSDAGQLLTAEAVAELLAIGLRTVRQWDSAGRLPEPVRLGKLVRWPAAEMRDWIQAGCPDRETWAARRKK